MEKNELFLSLSNPPCASDPQQNFFLSSESSQYFRLTSSAFRLRPTVNTIHVLELWIKNLGTTASVFVFVSTFLLEGDQNLNSTYILFTILFSLNTEKKMFTFSYLFEISFD